jgi:hypothetical protein
VDTTFTFQAMVRLITIDLQHTVLAPLPDARIALECDDLDTEGRYVLCNSSPAR